MTKQSHQLLLLPQRLKLAVEFAKAVAAGTRGSGVLLSGPNGVGKSGVGLLSYLLCAARRLPVVYLSRTETWIEAAQRGEGDAYLLSMLWEQNADLIAACEPLCTVFAAALQDGAGAFTPHVMNALRDAALRHRLAIGVILDEVQHITTAVNNGGASAATPAAFTAGSYFRNSWHDWMNDNRAFVRMSIASAHGERDYKLPAGESHRLRIVEPLSDEQRVALQSHKDSPAFIGAAADRERTVFFSGNILRALVEAAQSLSGGSSGAPPAQLQLRLGQLYASMLEDCGRWLAGLAEAERAEAAEKAMELLSGNLPWTAAKGLYDAGILYRTTNSDALRPVSAAASSAYLTATAKYVLGAAKPLSSEADGRLRGFALEAQVLARLATCDKLVGNKLLGGEHGIALWLRSSYVLPFATLEEVVPRETAVLYRPRSKVFACDGILMPAAGDKEGSVIVVECSTTSPRDAERVRKVLGYLKPGGVVAALKRRFPALPLHVALFYAGDLGEGNLSGPAAALSHGQLPADGAWATVGTAVRVFDRPSLVMLGGMVL
jgi:hypothetical protein